MAKKQPETKKAIDPAYVKVKTDYTAFRLRYRMNFVVWDDMVDDINTVVTPYDGKHTSPHLPAVVGGVFTLGIVLLVWHHKFAKRLGDELKRRNIDYNFGLKTLWLHGVLGILYIAGPAVYRWRLIGAVNLLCEDHNRKRMQLLHDVDY